MTQAGGTRVVTDPRRHAMVDAVRALAPSVAAASSWIEDNGRLPDELFGSLTDAGVFQMYQPAYSGGPEVEPLTALAVAEELARVDGSVGWCAQVSAAVTVFLAWIDPDALAEMAEITDGPLHVAGSARPLGTAVRAEGGYRVSGQWNYASGVRHANWFLGTSFLENDDGSRASRSMLIPIGDGRIVDNWDVVGMRGTGSDDFLLEDVFVPRSRSASRQWIAKRAEPLYDPRLLMVSVWAPTAGVGIGLAQGAIDALTDLKDAASTGSPTPLGERPDVQQALAEAEAITGAARAFCFEAIGDAWEAVIDDRPDLDKTVARAQISITHALNEAVTVADRCFHAAGTNAISTRNRLERILRDAHTAVQHAAGQRVHLRMAGRTLLGYPPPIGDGTPPRIGPAPLRP